MTDTPQSCTIRNHRLALWRRQDSCRHYGGVYDQEERARALYLVVRRWNSS